MITFFGIKGLVHYGDFKTTCERFIDSKGSLRKMVEMHMLGLASVCASSETDRNSCLIMDEVDKFFTKDFYGNEYRPLAQVRHQTISDLIKRLWENRDMKKALTLTEVQKTPQFKACLEQMPSPGCEELLCGAVSGMISCLVGPAGAHKDEHPYVVLNDKIGYHVAGHDDISWKASYGYSTMFAYMEEHANGSIGDEKMENQLALYINCGAFSYAEIPKSYTKIIGLTGTLNDLAGSQREMLRTEYSLTKSTFMPSVYGDNQLDFPGDSSKGCVIESETAGQHVAIVKAIEACENRAVLVFFETESALNTFRKSSHMAKYFGCTKVMTPETEPDDRRGLIAQAATKGNIMLLTREFGRGNDFVCYDKALNGNGGVHVIQTFVSEIRSEEAQIKGRTARQGSPGSFCMILEASGLERFGLGKSEIARMRSTDRLYTTIDRYRNDYFEAHKAEFTGGAELIRGEHLASVDFCTAFDEGRFSDVGAKLVEYNPPPPLTRASGGTLVLMDATGSMTYLLDKAKITVQEMFRRAETILKENDMDGTSCAMQFAVYRNYRSSSDLVAHSAWESSSTSLRNFMRDMHATGGEGNEAIEAGLQYANSISGSVDSDDQLLSQVVLIGDMPANTREEVAFKRTQAQGNNQHHWGGLFAKPTFWEDEVELLAAKSIPVHAFYVAEKGLKKVKTEDEFARALRLAGAKIGKLGCSLSWHNADDLDLHCVTPSGNVIYHGRKRADGGELDVDMHAGAPDSSQKLNPVENIVFLDPAPGTYKFYVHNYQKRTSGATSCVVRLHNSLLPDFEIQDVPDQAKVTAFEIEWAGGDARSNFEEIAERTGGKSGPLDINSEEGAEMLTGVVTRRLLDNVGGAALVAAYDTKFGYVEL
jgi:hypothetical protein